MVPLHLIQNKLVKEADDLLVILIPHAVTNSRTITRALNTAVFHKDFELMERLLAYGFGIVLVRMKTV